MSRKNSLLVLGIQALGSTAAAGILLTLAALDRTLAQQISQIMAGVIVGLIFTLAARPLRHLTEVRNPLTAPRNVAFLVHSAAGIVLYGFSVVVSGTFFGLQLASPHTLAEVIVVGSLFGMYMSLGSIPEADALTGQRSRLLVLACAIFAYSIILGMLFRTSPNWGFMLSVTVTRLVVGSGILRWTATSDTVIGDVWLKLLMLPSAILLPVVAHLS